MTAMHINWLSWPVRRSTYAFRAYVVEPSRYDLPTHEALFLAVLNRFNRPADYISEAGTQPDITSETPQPFDLLTFPEIFLPATALISILTSLSKSRRSTGCIHVGLSASNELEHPFFDRSELANLVGAIRQLLDPSIANTDLQPIEDWLQSNPNPDGHLNAGCMFMVDADRRLRTCVHLKNVPSQYEAALLRQKRVAEARMVTVITLLPIDNRSPSVVIQPLICSDALEVDTLQQGIHPLTVLTDGAQQLESRPPDHIDIISVAACTPQATLGRTKRLRWKHEFLSSFVKAASHQSWRRHQYSLFVLANYLVPPSDTEKLGSKPGAKNYVKTAGLSGLFIPSVYAPGPHEAPVLIDLYARPNDKSQGEVRWMTIEEFEEDILPGNGISPKPTQAPLLGSVVMLKPPDPETLRPSASLFCVAIQHLPRHANRWQRSSGKLSDLRVYTIQV